MGEVSHGLDDGIRRLRACDNEVIDNPHYDEIQGEE